MRTSWSVVNCTNVVNQECPWVNLEDLKMKTNEREQGGEGCGQNSGILSERTFDCPLKEKYMISRVQLR